MSCIVVRKRYPVKKRVNYLLTQVVQSNKYYKSCTVGVTSEVGLTTDRNLAEPSRLRNTMSFIPLRYPKSRGTSDYTTVWLIDPKSISLMMELS